MIATTFNPTFSRKPARLLATTHHDTACSRTGSADPLADTVVTRPLRSRSAARILTGTTSRPPRPQHTRQQTRIGLVLSGGLARGVAHIGVLQVFAEAGIEVNCVAGTSVGAFVGLMHCAGYTPAQMADIARQELMPQRTRRWLPGAATLHLAGLLRTGRLRECIERHVPAATRLENLPLPLAVTSTDIVTGEALVHRSGLAVPAVMASMAFPGLAPPVEFEGRTLVDGGVLNNLPGDALARSGMDFVIGVDLAQPCKAVRPGLGSFGLALRSRRVLQRKATSSHAQWIDVLIRPDVARFPKTDVTRFDGLLDAGAAAARQMLPQILERLATT